MVRPIEITDSLSKTEAVQRVQQNQKVLPEAAQHFQKSLTGKLAERVKIPNPVIKDDQVVLHVGEEDKEKQKNTKDGKHESDEQKDQDIHGQSENRDEDTPSHDHIDIKA